MALKPIAIKNHKGQAMLEATGMMFITGVFLYLLLRALLVVIFAVALDAMAEDYFFCELASKTDCEQKLYSRLLDHQMRNIKIITQRPGQKIILTVSATYLASMTITREFDYEKFYQQL